jgi:uncharacterized protein (DUF2141 family)
LRWVGFVYFLAVPGSAAADLARLEKSDLHIHITGVETDRGVVQYGLYDSARNFPSRQGRVAKGEVQAASKGVTVVIRGLKPGYYAVAVFHDENLNDSFDQGLFGIPLENYGFSNDASGFFSAPDFEDARFKVGGPETKISIKLGR